MSRSIRVLLFLGVLGLAWPGLGAEPITPPWEKTFFGASAQDLVAAAKGARPAGAEHIALLFKEAVVTYLSDGQMRKQIRSVYQVLNDQGLRDWSDIKVQFSPWRETRPMVHVRVNNPDGGQFDIRTEDLVEGAEGQGSDLYSDGRVLSGPYPRVMIGSVIEEEIVYQKKPLLAGCGVSSSWAFGEENALAFNRLILEYPATTTIQTLVRGLPEGAQETTANGLKRLTWQWRNQPKVDFSESNLPPNTVRQPRVSFSNAPSWGVLAQFYSDQIEPIVSASAAGLPKVPDVDKSDARQACIDLIHWMNANLRYTGLEFGVNAIVPVAPATVFQRGFGDCKDKALVLVSLLRRLGIDAHLALLWSGSGADVNPELSGLDFFDHAIVWVGGPKPFFADPTVDYSRTVDLPYSDQYRYILVAKPKAGGLERTDQLGAEKAVVKEIRDVTFSDFGPGDVTETTIYQDTIDTYYRNYYAYKRASEITETFDSYAKRQYGVPVSDMVISKAADYSQPFTISFKARGNNLVRTDKDTARFDFPLTGIWDFAPKALLEKASKARQYPFRLTVPINLEARATLRLPDGFRYTDKPISVSRQAGFLTFSEQVNLEADGRLSIVVRLVSTAMEMSPQQFEVASKSLQAIRKDFDEVSVKLNLDAALKLGRGAYQAAFADYRAMVAAHPDRFAPMLRLSRALLGVGLGEAAQAAAKKATDLAPTSAEAWANLAWCLEFDAFGRRFGQGYLRTESIKAYRKAIELAPDVWYHRGNLAVLLEYDQAGFHYTGNVDLAEAVAEYRQIDDLAGHEMDADFWRVLFYHGDLEEAGRLAPDLSERADADAATLTIDSVSQGVGKALGELESWSPDRLLKAEATAVEWLFETRRYGLAADLLRAQATLTKDSKAAKKLTDRAEVLEKVKPLDTAFLKTGTPEATMVAFLQELSRSDGKLTSGLRALLTERQAAWFVAQPKELLTIWSDYVATANRAGLSFQILIDSISSRATLDSWGDATNGWFVRYFYDGNEIRDGFFVVPGPTLRIAATKDQWWLLGQEIRSAVAAGQPQRALEWLAWVTDSAGLGPRGTLVRYLQNSPREPYFAFYWPDLKDDPGHAKLVASLLEATQPQFGADLTELEAFFNKYWDKPVTESAASLKLDPGRFKRALELAGEVLIAAYRDTNRADKGVAVAEAMYKADRQNHSRIDTLARALFAAGKFTGANRLLADSLKREPKAADLLNTTIEFLAATPDRTSTEKIMTEYQPKLNADLLNSLAWVALFSDGDLTKAIDQARQAVEKTESRFHADQHTLATLYARAGRVEDALKVLSSAIDCSRYGQPTDDDRIVLALVADYCGFPDIAQKLYTELAGKMGGNGAPDSVPALASSLLRRR